MKAKRDNITSELISFSIMKTKAKENWGGGGRGSNEIHLKIGCHANILIGINKFLKAKAKKYVGGINFSRARKP